MEPTTSTSRQLPFDRGLASATTRSATGPTLASCPSSGSGARAASASTGCETSRRPLSAAGPLKRKAKDPGRASATRGSRARSRGPTSSARSKRSRKPSPNGRSSKTSARASTGSGPDSSPFWTEPCAAISQRLPSATATGSAGSRSSSSSTCCATADARSWFRIKLMELEERPLQTNQSSRTTCSQSSRSLSRAITASVLRQIEGREGSRPQKKQKKEKKKRGKEEKDKAGRCLKWRIFPSKEQRDTLLLWCDAVRWSYNKGAEHVNTTRDWSLKGIRQAMHLSDEEWKEHAPERMRGSVPYEVRDSAAQDINKACKALKAKEKKFKRDLKFKRKKDDKTSIALRARQLNCESLKGKIWPAIFGTTKDRSAMKTEKGKTLPLLFEHDCRLVYDRVIGEFSLCVPSAAVIRSDTQGPLDQLGEPCGRGIVSIDPGIKTFATCYDPEDGSVHKWGDKPWLLAWLSRKCDRLISKARNHHGQSRRRILKVAARIRRRTTDLVSELHRKLALWLCRNFSVVLLPKFSPKRCGQRKNLPLGKRRSLGKKATRRMMQLGHFRFRQSLGHKCREFGTELVVCDEAYTSMTCGRCGMLNRRLALKDRTFSCPTCGWAADRDANGARNVLLRYLATEAIDFSENEGQVYRPVPEGGFMPL